MGQETCQSCTSQDCSQDKPVEDKLQRARKRIKHTIAVLSGKGGVGKSTVAANLAVALSMAGKKVGLLDVDVHGPSIPRILSLTNAKPHIESDCIEPVSWDRNLWVMSLGFMIPDPSGAVIWRGPMKTNVIRQFIEDVAWGDLDALVVDCPPGTGDEPLSVLQLLENQARALIVTTPQNVAVDDVRRSVSFCRDLETPVLGILENMSGFVCPTCKDVTHIFAQGGGERLAAEMGVTFLGRIPIDPELVRAGDEGYAFVKVHPESPTSQAFTAAVAPILTMVGSS